ncbi:MULTISPECIES: extracellular solute-binding protein [Streptomyces]|uniref:Extracellular solute-binding protein n=1 Tax=Streptomyces yunnanensis TaxID=156453 RepID=A0ABY8AE19_9ACTN|nr:MULTISPECIES: extracellular solute-binding protein [Streptomyces]AJC58832.1 putative extracellular solute-binding protein [Streptomyces sp. 769]WEB42916.1 extracellular solute-binding protein [Streptomyces yunnanensis]
MTYESADSRRGGVRRRTVLGGAAAAAAGLALAGCGDDGDAPRERRKGQKITLTFWSWVPGIDRPVDLWNRTHPEVQVKVEKVSAVNGEQYAKMHAAIKAGDPPDLGQIEFPVIPGFLLDGGLRDLAPLGAARHRDAFFAWQWGQSVFGSGIYAIPQASGPMGLFVRQDLFDRWGIPVPRTWDAYEAAAQEVRRHGAWIETFAPTNGNRFAGLAWQAGAKWYATHGDTWVVHLDDAPTRRVADYWEQLVRRKLVKTIPDRRDAWYKDIQTGAIPAWVGASWGDALLAGNAPGTKGKWRAAPLPQWQPGGRAYANWGGSTTAVFAKASYPKDALDFAVWLNTDPGSIALLLRGGYGFPSAKAGYAATALDADKDFFGGQPYSRVFADAGAHVDTSWQWGPGVDTLFQRLGDAFTDALADGSSFRSVLTKVQRQTISDLRDKGLKAESGR